MYYNQLRDITPKDVQRRAINGITRLRDDLDLHVPDKDAEENLLLATWNIRDLTKTKSRRLPESLFYIAEIISRFDFVAVQEVNGLEEWQVIMRILGPDWDFIASDESDRKGGGNGERLTYVFDKRKVWFQNIAGEIVLPPDMLISQVESNAQGDKIVPKLQFSRTPFVASFQSGWFKFSICTVHIYFGKNSGDKLERRKEEIAAVAEYFGEKADQELRNNRSLILLGDFNIVSPEHKTMKALEDQKFVIPEALRNKPSNALRTKHYDQIAFRADEELIEYVDRQCSNPLQCNAGVFDIYESVFRADDEKLYDKAENRGKRKFTTWRTYQMSDHLPMWVRLNVNASSDYLDQLLAS